MEAIGLMPSSTAAPGGKRTGDRMSHYIIEGWAIRASVRSDDPRVPLVLALLEGTGKEGAKRPRAVSKVKFTCSSCDANTWGRPDLLLSCGACAIPMTAGAATRWRGGRNRH
jgi:hypothetical protein